MKKMWATRSRGVGLLLQRTGAVIMRQTVMTHCSHMTFLKMMMMVTIMHTVILHSPVLCCTCMKTRQTRMHFLFCTLIAVRKPIAVAYLSPCMQHSTAQHSTALHSTAQHSTAQHSTAQHCTAQHSTAQHSTAQHGKVTYATQCLCKEQSVVAGHPLICPPSLTNVSLCRTDVWHQARGLTAAQQTPAFTCFFT